MNWREIVDNAKERAVDTMDTKSVITKFLGKCDTLHLSDQQKSSFYNFFNLRCLDFVE